MYGSTEALCRSPAVVEAGHSSVPLSSLDASSDARVAWLQRCAPVIMQPQVDIANGFGLRRVFFDFRPSERKCELSLIYDGEASYGYTNPVSLNRVATFFYRSFNFRTYNRTADVDRLVFEGTTLPPTSGSLWTDLFTTDYPRDQTWSRGDKCSFCCWFSLMSHYNARIPKSAWQRAGGGAGAESDEHRPIVWLATANHMMSEQNCNRDIDFPGGWKAWCMDEYDPHLGTRACAEAWAQTAVPVKTNFFSCCCWKVQRPAAAYD